MEHGPFWGGCRQEAKLFDVVGLRIRPRIVSEPNLSEFTGGHGNATSQIWTR